MSETLIKVEGVSKKFCRSLKRSLWYGLQDIGSEAVGARRKQDELRPDEFWAVRGVSFEVRRGECLALIGRNGAGKTTLLKMLNGLIKPDQGRIDIRGRVGALIALGAGFNPLLTGRENIYVNGAVLGLTRKEIDAKVEDIVDFAGIPEFIDSPVQTYSSGMQVRLGFAVATTVEPDVLILDEVLAVGDAAFRSKCYDRIGQIQRSAAVIFVSHGMDQVAQVCDTAVYLEKGELKYSGEVGGGVRAYESDNVAADGKAETFLKVSEPFARVDFLVSPERLTFGDVFSFEARFDATQDADNFMIKVAFINQAGVIAAEWNGKRLGRAFAIRKGANRVVCDMGPVHLMNGRYLLSINIQETRSTRVPVWSYKQHFVDVYAPVGGLCPYQMPSPAETQITRAE